jgi:hypothetical protein
MYLEVIAPAVILLGLHVLCRLATLRYRNAEI